MGPLAGRPSSVWTCEGELNPGAPQGARGVGPAAERGRGRAPRGAPAGVTGLTRRPGGCPERGPRGESPGKVAAAEVRVGKTREPSSLALRPQFPPVGRTWAAFLSPNPGARDCWAVGPCPGCLLCVPFPTQLCPGPTSWPGHWSRAPCQACTMPACGQRPSGLLQGISLPTQSLSLGFPGWNQVTAHGRCQVSRPCRLLPHLEPPCSVPISSRHKPLHGPTAWKLGSLRAGNRTPGPEPSAGGSSPGL